MRGLLLFSTLILAACGSNPPPPQTVSIAPLPPTSVQPAPSETPRAHPTGVVRVDKTLKFDDSEWLVLDARDAGQELQSTNHISDEVKKTEGRFILVHYKVTNLLKKSEMLLDRPKIVDGKTREFGAIEMETFFIPAHTKAIGLEVLEPNVQQEYWTVIEVPLDSHRLKFQLHGFSLLGEKQTVDLGL